MSWTFDVVDLILAVLTTAAITAAIASPKLRRGAIAVALLAGGAILGRRLGRNRDAGRSPGDDPGPTPDTTPIPNPSTDLKQELDHEEDRINRLPDSDLDDAWAAHRDSAEHGE